MVDEKRYRDSPSRRIMFTPDGNSPLTPAQTPFQTPQKSRGKRNETSPRIPLRFQIPMSPFGPSITSMFDLSNIFEKYPMEIFNNISFSPERDDEKFARFNNNNILISATIPRLIVQLTSHDILDYNFMSDFFLSYRNFMSSDDILECLFSRLTWAICFSYKIRNAKVTEATKIYSTETGRDIAIRVFVVLRHWVLNFFPDDFVISFRIRSRFSSCINKLYNWSLVQNDPHFKRILDQLKKAWVTSCYLYWQHGEPPSMERFDASLPIFPGGPFGKINSSTKRSASRQIIPASKISSHSQRRFTLLSFYKGPIQPVVRNSELKDFQDSKGIIPGQDNNESVSFPFRTGFLINGGLSLHSDVEVKSIKPPTPVRSMEELRTLEMSPTTKTNLTAMVDNWKEISGKPSKSKGGKLLASFCHIMAISKSKHNRDQKTDSQSSDSTDEIRIDILSARVIEELDLFLKMRFSENTQANSQAPQTPPKQETGQSSNERLSSRESPTKKLRLDVKPAASFDSRHEQYDDTYYGVIGDKLRDDSVDSVRASSCYDTPARTSMIDSLGIQDKLSISSPSGVCEEFEFDDYSASNRSESFSSYGSYDSSNTFGKELPFNNTREPPVKYPKLRRWGNHENLREIANLSRPASESHSLHPRDLSMDVDTEEISHEVIQRTSAGGKTSYDKMMLEYTGLATEVAAKLAAIPDDIPDEDAINAALLKIEGRYVKSEKKAAENAMSSETQFELTSESEEELLSPPTQFELRLDLEEDPPCEQVSSNSETESASDTDSVASIESVQNTSTYNSNLFRRAFESKFDLSSPPSGREFKDMIPQTPSRKPTITKEEDIFSRKSLVRNARPPEDPLSVANAVYHGNHTPFILNFGSKALCSQFTLIERDALMEVDWKDLIEMNWTRRVVPIQSWLEFLVERDSRGVELVISRFNLMVNWIKSELLLTRQLDERVQTMSRFIHIGHHALKSQNLATVMQVVLALQSPIVTKLKNTWKRIPENDGRLFLEMCDLTSPSKNFGKLRTELLELRPDSGCVPFLGMYLSDLTFNSDRPTFVDSDQVNIEKFQTLSSIVKSLLQCIEWSTKYDLHADFDLLAKCLYIQSLTIEEMDVCFDYLVDP